MNLVPGAGEGPDCGGLGTLLDVSAGKRWLTTASPGSGARPVAMICVLHRCPGSPPGAHALPANPMLLAPYMLGLSTSARRARSRFCLYADLVERTPLIRLAGALESTPGQLADAVQDAFAQRSACAREAVT
jgi:hypothetical protein